LKLYYAECLEGDIVFAVSDGVHDNFDPQQLGKLPRDLELNCPSWEDAEKQLPIETEAAKNNFRTKLMEQLISKGGKRIRAKSVSRKLLAYCTKVTEAGRQWMIENPTKKLPPDYVQYPGKMDHATVAALQVGTFKELPKFSTNNNASVEGLLSKSPPTTEANLEKLANRGNKT
jgi:hypothetical protein